MNIYQGDQVLIAIKLKDTTGTVITDDDVSKVVVSLGDVIHSTEDTEDPVAFDSDTDAWMFTLSQEDTLAMQMCIKALQAEVTFDDGSIGNATVAKVFILPSDKKEVE